MPAITYELGCSGSTGKRGPSKIPSPTTESPLYNQPTWERFLVTSHLHSHLHPTPGSLDSGHTGKAVLIQYESQSCVNQG